MNNNRLTGAALDCKSLLATNDIEFIECAYLTLLNRAPDAEGLNYYLSRLRSGKPKLQILAQLQQSEEAHSIQAEVPGLDHAIRTFHRSSIPLIGHLYKRALRELFDSERSVNGKSASRGSNARLFRHTPVKSQIKAPAAPAPVFFTPPEIDHRLKDILSKAKEAFWAGTRPPFGWMRASARIYDGSFDYRMSADFHQTFDVVYLTERDLGGIKAWPLVLDEAMRLLAPGGTLVIRMTNTALLTNFELKNHIGSWGGMEIQFEHTFDHGPLLFAVRNTRTERREAGLDGYSLGVITDGRSPTLMNAFIDSALALKRRPGQQIEIIVCGPPKIATELAARRDPRVIHVVQAPEFERLGWITRKKNQIVDASRYENIVIVHDRYQFPDDFLTNFDTFGGDYSVVIPRQTRPDGRRMPDWVTLGSEWSLTSPSFLEYGDWNRHIFVNGGIMIAKREVLKRVPWNELLFWGQTEDVELTRRMRAAGYVPRLARHVNVISSTMRNGLVNGFESSPMVPHKYMNPEHSMPCAEQTTPVLKYHAQANFGTHWHGRTAEMGVYVDSAWRSEAAAIVLEPGVFGEITFKLPAKPTAEVTLLVGIEESSDVPTVMVNDVEVSVRRLAGNQLRIDCPLDAFPTNNIARLHVISKGRDIRLNYLLIQPPALIHVPKASGKLSFARGGDGVPSMSSGWSQPEDWGCWMLGNRAEVVLHNPRATGNFLIEGVARGFVRPPATETVIGMYINEIPVGYFRLQAGFENQPFSISAPREITGSDPGMRISFAPIDPVSPQEIGMNMDTRLLSLGLVSLTVTLPA